jgi:exopolysaccharide biosynthesis protein
MLKKIVSLSLLLFLAPTFFVEAADLSGRLSGRILLDVERNGEAWYVYPEDNKRYYLGRPHDAFAIMRELGLGISEEKFATIVPDLSIAITADSATGTKKQIDQALLRSLSGKIVLQVEKNGEAWYIDPVDLSPYYLGRPADAFAIMRKLGLGITSQDLALIHKPGLSEQLDEWSKYEHKKMEVGGKEYVTDVITIDLDDPDLRIITDTSDTSDCESACKAGTLGDFVLSNKAFAGINGTYFESYDKSRLNYYFYPVYNTNEKVLINEDQLKYWTTGPIMAWDDENNFYYFKDSRDFPVKDWYKNRDESVAEAFRKEYGKELQAAIGNKPRLIEEGMNLLIEWDIEDKQRYSRSTRNALAYKSVDGKKGMIYLVVAKDATVPELADLMKHLKVDYALNLDGGYSAALWYNDEYMVKPGRDIPNAILFATR